MTLYPKLSVEEAVERFINYFKPLDVERKSILEALGMVLGEEIISDMDIPPLANTAMDGYAVKCEDTVGATKDAPRKIKVVGDLAAGDYLDRPLLPGTAIRIMTGAPVPPGTEAVIPFEHVDVEGNSILVFKEYKLNKNIRLAGEDVKAGQVVLEPGMILRPQEIGMLAALGYTDVLVHRCPRVAILSTGNELIEAQAPWRPGKIRDANGYSNAAQVIKYGGKPLRLGIARDTTKDLSGKIREAINQEADLILTSGGVSVGDFDVVKEVLAAEGEITFWRVKMKPGKPVAFGTIRGVPLLGLPGNPVSAMVSFEIFARPAILTMLGKKKLEKPTIDAVLVDEIPHKDDRRHYVRVTLREQEGIRYAHLTGDQGSGILYSMVKAEGLAIIPEGLDHLPAGTPVEVMMLDGE